MSITEQQLQQLRLLKENADMQRSGSYVVKSDVREDVFRAFLAKLAGNPVTVTKENFDGLKLLCQEFVFPGFENEFKSFSAASCHRAISEGRATLADILLHPQWPQFFNARDPELFALYALFLIPASYKMSEIL